MPYPLLALSLRKHIVVSAYLLQYFSAVRELAQQLGDESTVVTIASELGLSCPSTAVSLIALFQKLSRHSHARQSSRRKAGIHQTRRNSDVKSNRAP